MDQYANSRTAAMRSRVPSRASASLLDALLTSASIAAFLLTVGPAQSQETRIIDGGESVTIPGTYPSPWMPGGVIVVGESGTGRLTIENGGQVVSNFSYIGGNAGSSGTVVVRGAGSHWRTEFASPAGPQGAELYIGYWGTGTLIIEDGGSVSNGDAFIGWPRLEGVPSTSTGIVRVTGPGSLWSTRGIYLGYNDIGGGTLLVEKGGKINSSWVHLMTGANATALVTGIGTEWTSSGTFNISAEAVDSEASLTIADGAVVTAPMLTLAGMTISSRGQNNLALNGTDTARGKLATGQVQKITGNAAVTFDGGVLQATSDQADFLSGFAAGDVTIASGGAFIDSDGHDIGISAVFNGTGDLTKLGEGTLTLTGASTFTGTTDVAGGALSVNGSLASTSTQVQAGATLTGSGALAGAVTVQDGGTLAGFHGQTLTMGSLALASDATLSARLGGNGSTALFGVTGNLAFNGKLAIDAASNLTGATHYTLLTYGGTLTRTPLLLTSLPVGYKASNFTLDTSDGHVTLAVSAAEGQQVWRQGSGAWTSTATHWQDADGNLVSAWAGDTAIFQGSGGTVTVEGSQSLSALRFEADGYTLAHGGAGELVFTDDGNAATREGIRVENGFTATVAAPISGTSTLVKDGTGTLNLTGTNAFSGQTVVEAGRLAVNGSLANSVVTVESGSLGGTGTVGGIIVQSGGTIAPGNSIGTLNVAGNIGFAPGSIYQVEINAAGQSDRIAATGRAILSGGTIQILPDQGIGYVANSPYTILTAARGVNGKFSGTSGGEFAFITPTLGYSSDAVTLTMVRRIDPPTPQPPTPESPTPQPIAFHAVAETKNQYRTADGVEGLGAGNTLYKTILGTSVSGARQAFDALSGEAHASVMSVAYDNGRLVREAILTRLRQPLGSRLASIVQGNDSAAYATDLPGAASQPTAMPVMSALRYSFWGEGFGSFGSIDSNGNAASLDTSTGGFILGADALVSEAVRIGVAGGFTRTTFDVVGRLSSGSNDSVFGALYGSSSWGVVSLRLGASYTWHDFDVSRSIRFPGFADRTHASYGGWTAQAFAELGYRLDLGRVTLEPFAGASVLRLHTDGFAEEGGATALTGYAQDQDLATTTLGLRAETRLSEDLPLTLRGLLGWRHAYGDVEPEMLLAFAGGASTFTVAGAPVDRDALVAEAGLDWQASEAISLGIAYSGQIGEQAQEHALKGSFIWRFGSY